MASRLLIDTTRLQKCRCFDNRGNNVPAWLDQCEAMGCFTRVTSTSLYLLLRVRPGHAANNQTADQFGSITTTASTTSRNGITAPLSVFPTESCDLILAVLRCQRGRVRKPYLGANKVLDGTHHHRDVTRSSLGALLFRVANSPHAEGANFIAWEPTRLEISLFLSSAGVATE